MIAAVRRGAYAATLLAAMAGAVLVAAPASADPTPPEPGLVNCDNTIQQGGEMFDADIAVPRKGIDVLIAHPGPLGAAYKVTASDALSGTEFSKIVYFPPGYRRPKNVVIGNAYEKGWSKWSVKVEPQVNLEATYGVEVWTGACDGDWNATVSGRSEASFAAAAAEADAARIELENEENAYCYAFYSWNDGGWGPYLYMHWDNLDCINR
jgi:hypothetical protein